MRQLRKFIAMLLVAVWAPVSMHCTLEALPGFEFLQCATDEPAQSDCADDGCEVIESPCYKVEDNPPIVSPLVWVPAASFTVPQAEDWVRLGRFCDRRSSAPPELSQSWQFTLRAASPVRAPSFAS